MRAKTIAAVTIIVVGIAVLIVSATADITGIGVYPQFGKLQTAGVIAGAIVAVAGLALLLKKGKPAANG
jgi:uncharacterized membrane protein